MNDPMAPADRHMQEWQDMSEEFDRSTYERFYFMEQLLMGAFSLLFTGPHQGDFHDHWIAAYRRLGLCEREVFFVGYQALAKLEIDSNQVPLYSRERVRNILFEAAAEIENRSALQDHRYGYGKMIQLELDAAACDVRNFPVS